MRSITFALVAAGIAVVQAVVLERRAITLPQGNGKFDYQLGGAYDPPSGTVTVVRDRTDPIAADLYNVCYINAFQTQPDQEDTDWWKQNHDNLLLRRSNGSYFIDPNWPKEIILDTRGEANQQAIADILNEWINECATNGFKAIEPDNLDTWTREDSPLSQDDNLAVAKLIADHAHSKDLAIAQKNAAEISRQGKDDVGFDFAIAEECQAQRIPECDDYINVYGDLVFEIEYTDNDNAEQVFAAACADHGSRIAVIYRDRDLVTPDEGNQYHYEDC
ncbi:glycoside hydrolase family 114 protein [Coprinopsis sp. MPI-PUGE-AT-0042]|nr:glycoside hydrolase family 114 protein [Coprinopsis sp. MPI-PUGE-AT-0042]